MKNVTKALIGTLTAVLALFAKAFAALALFTEPETVWVAVFYASSVGFWVAAGAALAYGTNAVLDGLRYVNSRQTGAGGPP